MIIMRIFYLNLDIIRWWSYKNMDLNSLRTTFIFLVVYISCNVHCKNNRGKEIDLGLKLTSRWILYEFLTPQKKHQMFNFLKIFLLLANETCVFWLLQVNIIERVKWQKTFWKCVKIPLQKTCWPFNDLKNSRKSSRILIVA